MDDSRASIFDSDSDELPQLDISGFSPKPKAQKTTINKETIKSISEESKFPSRQSKPKVEPEVQERAGRGKRRQYRTGRICQFNVKATSEYLDLFYALADKLDEPLTVTFERAIRALEKEIGENPTKKKLR